MLILGCEFYPKPASGAMRSHEHKSVTNDEVRRNDECSNDEEFESAHFQRAAIRISADRIGAQQEAPARKCVCYLHSGFVLHSLFVIRASSL
jgi:hypothetical protein